MGTSVKAILQLAMIISAIGALIIWALPNDQPDGITWCFRLGFPAMAIFLIVILAREAGREEILPDLLLQRTGSYFEQGGFCFGFVPIVINGISWMQIYFHNRYERPCSARVVLQPPREYFLGKQLRLLPIDVKVECGGAEFGVCRAPWPIPRRLQGKKKKYEVACDVKYPRGRGKLLRFREGGRVGTPGEIYFSRTASLTVILPGPVGELRASRCVALY